MTSDPIVTPGPAALPLLFPTGSASTATPTRQAHVEGVLRVLSHIQDHLDEVLSLEDLATRARMSPSTLAHVFPGVVGETLWQLVKRLRLERGAFNLLMSRHNVLDVALASGFGSQASFTRAFRAAYGVTPARFRRQDGRHLLPTLEAPTGIHVSDAGGLKGFTPIPDLSKELPVRVVDLPATRIAYFRGLTAYDDGMPWGWNTLFDWAWPRGHVTERTRFLGIIRQDPYMTPPGRLFCDYSITIEDESFTGDGIIGAQTIPGGQFATLHVEGPLDHHLRTYNAMTYQWLPQSRYTLRHSMRMTDNKLSLDTTRNRAAFMPGHDWWLDSTFHLPVSPGPVGGLLPL